MLCTSPIKFNQPRTMAAVAIKCRKCMSCKINQRREWVTRLLLESNYHDHAVFITLTYNDENLPQYWDYPGGNLVKKHLIQFFDTLRITMKRKNDDRKIRYFATGEYGERSSRAHYHAIIYGLSEQDTQLINGAWNKGFTHVREFTPERAQYVAGYTTKKLGEDNLEGRHPVFMLSSKKPAIGKSAFQAIAKLLYEKGPKETVLVHNRQIRLRGKLHPLDDYSIREINKEIFRQYGRYKSVDRKQIEMSPEEFLEMIKRRIADEKKAKKYKKRQTENEQRNLYICTDGSST